jgi:hypothetical protein
VSAAPAVAQADPTARSNAKSAVTPSEVKLDEAAPADSASKPAARGLLEMMQASERGEEVKPPEAKPPEAKPPEAKSPEAKAPEASAATGSRAPGF